MRDQADVKEAGGMSRASFNSRLGFILVSAGCAIGIGNVWKFPYLCGQYGGAAFILIYLLFLLILGIPVMICEFSVGRSSRQSISTAYDTLEPAGTRWDKMKIPCVAGNYLLMMYYTTVCGWMLNYTFKHIAGTFSGETSEQVSRHFTEMMGNFPELLFWTVLVCVIGFAVCFLGVQNGVERITKYMMTALLLLMIVLAVHSLFLKGAGAGIRYYLVPSLQTIREKGLGTVVFAAMSQAFFTLSIGMGSMEVFGSYIDKSRSLAGEACTVTLLDTFVALMAGFIVIPACFAFQVPVDAGPKLIFLTIPNLFTQMTGGRFWGALFFVFLSFAALTTVIAVFENIVAFDIDLFGWSRKKSVLVSAVLVILLSIPCVAGFNLWSGFQPLGEGTSVMDLEDFIVSNNILPLGSLVFVLFCTQKNGWGWDSFIEEADTGTGLKFPRRIRGYMRWVLPLIILVIYVKGYWDFFSPQGTAALIRGMSVAAACLVFIFWCVSGKVKKEEAARLA